MSLRIAMPLLLVEDDISESLRFQEHIKSRSDVRLVGATASSTNGLELVKRHLPEAVILDLELRHGEGSGVSFLAGLQTMQLPFRPLVVATTNITSETILDHVREFGMDFVFSKSQVDYEPKLIVDFVLDLRPTVQKRNRTELEQLRLDFAMLESKEERKQRVMDKIEHEMDLLGISNNLKGRTYAIHGIYYLLTCAPNTSHATLQDMFEFLAKKFNKQESSMARAIQTAIRRAFDRTPIDELLLHYTDRINYNTGLPTTLEFLSFYAKKIRRLI